MPLSRAALATAPVAVVGSLALAMGAADAAAAAESHEVRPGDTVAGIAIRNGLQTADVLRWNDLTYATASSIRPGQSLRLHAPDGRAPAAKAASVERPAQKIHEVSAGDTLWSIASAHGVSLGALLKANGLKASSIIYPGQKLKLSGGTPAASSDRSPVPASSSTEPAQAKTHTVAAGDTLWAIASEHGTTVDAILAANGLERGAIIYPGQKLALSAPSEQTTETAEQRFASLDARQADNARAIIRVGREVGAGERAIAEALATAMVESSLRNVSHGHLDSIGLFQQRPSQGWGTKEEIADRAHSIRAFFGGAGDPNGYSTRGLFDFAGWQEKPFGTPSQNVQLSDYPDRYAQWETQAYRWVDELG